MDARLRALRRRYLQTRDPEDAQRLIEAQLRLEGQDAPEGLNKYGCLFMVIFPASRQYEQRILGTTDGLARFGVGLMSRSDITDAGGEAAARAEIAYWARHAEPGDVWTYYELIWLIAIGGDQDALIEAGWMPDSREWLALGGEQVWKARQHGR